MGWAASTHAKDWLPLQGAEDNGASVLLSNADGTSPYTGVVRYQGRGSCSGGFLATSSQNSPRDGPAYVLTNGHCAAFPGANEVLRDLPYVFCAIPYDSAQNPGQIFETILS